MKILGIALIILSIVSLIISFYVGIYETMEVLGNEIQTNRLNDEFVLFIVLSIFLFIIGLVLIILNRNDLTRK